MGRHRRRRRWPWVVAAGLLACGALAWWFPARWVWPWIQAQYPAVHARTVAGSIWNGHLDGLVVNGQRFGRLDWSLSRRSVFGYPRARLHLAGDEVMANGHIARADGGAIVLDNWRFQVPLARLKVLWPTAMTLGGRLRGQVRRLRLSDGWPTVLEADVAWHDATATTRDGRTVALGGFRSHWTAPGGSVVQADLDDSGDGPVALDGRFVVTSLGWRLDARARARRPEPGLDALLRQLGERDADGAVRLRRRGGLAR